MDTRRLGRTDLYLTEIGLGTWAMGGGGPGYYLPWSGPA
jgi:aryl-alcohol dehydrogenase-like predicted oxidoreductase